MLAKSSMRRELLREDAELERAMVVRLWTESSRDRNKDYSPVCCMCKEADIPRTERSSVDCFNSSSVVLASDSKTLLPCQIVAWS